MVTRQKHNQQASLRVSVLSCSSFMLRFALDFGIGYRKWESPTQGMCSEVYIRPDGCPEHVFLSSLISHSYRSFYLDHSLGPLIIDWYDMMARFQFPRFVLLLLLASPGNAILTRQNTPTRALRPVPRNAVEDGVSGLDALLRNSESWYWGVDGIVAHLLYATFC
jgi:hypothetical protein